MDNPAWTAAEEQADRMRQVLVLVLVVVAVSLAPATTARAAAASTAARTAAGAPREGLAEALAVLRDWDGRRADAWAREDLAGLRVLYASGSGAGHADVRLLRAYRARGLVVRRLETQVLAAWVLSRTPRSMSLRVVDRVAGGEVWSRATARASTLASTPPVARTVVFRLLPDGWRVARVSGSG